MRIAHVTDLHVELPLRVSELASKRAIGAFNLRVMGRSRHFTLASIEALVARVVAEQPDLVVCTGDLTSTATAREFERARALLAPVIDRFPFVCIPGNHDVYTPDGFGRYLAQFGEFGGSTGFPFRRSFDGLEVIGLHVSRPALTSQGIAPDDQLAALERLLGEGSGPALVLLHYPLRGRDGAPYRPWTRNLRNAARLEALLARHPRVIGLLHGHEHHGFRTTLPGGLPSFDPGAGGYAHLPKRRRTAHFNLYELTDGALSVSRFAYDGRAFLPEAGGAYATGR
jgi:Icc protein